MKFNKFQHEVRAEVTFTKEEYEFLIELAKLHYDNTCREAGLLIGEVHQHEPSMFSYPVEATRNGFLAQLKLFPTTPEYTAVIWPFSHFDITMKILEQRDYLPKQLDLANKIASDIMRVLRGINEEYKRLNS